MKQTITVRRATVNIHVGCFGNFRLADPVCRKHCALRIRCAIERDQNAFMETIEGMETGADLFFNFQ